MATQNDAFKAVYEQLINLELPIQAIRHYLDSIPEENAHHSLFMILTEKLETEFSKLQQVSLQSISK